MKRSITPQERAQLARLLSRAALHGRRQSAVQDDVRQLLGATSGEAPIVVWPSDPDREEADTDRMLALYGITVEGA